jgi:hypothetical protein
MGLRADLEQPQAPEDFVVLRWRDHRFYGETCGPTQAGGTIHTSQRTLLVGARMLSPIFGTTDGLDLRALALVAAVLIGVLVAALVRVAPGGRRVGLLLAAVVLASLVDRGVAGVFASATTDAAALIGLVACVVLALVVLRRAPATAGPLVALASAGAFTVLSMPQLVVVAPLIAAALVWHPSRTGTVGQASMRQRLRRRPLGTVLAAGVLALGIWSLGVQPTAVGDAHRHGQVFGTILVRGGDPASDLAWLGLDPSLAGLAGSSADARDDHLESEAYRSYDEQVRWKDVLWFYALHPGRLADLGLAGIDAAATYRDHEIGSFPRGAGVGPRRPESRVWTTSFFFALADAVPALLVVVLAGSLLAAATVLKRRLSDEATALALVALGLAIGAISSFWMVLLAVGQVHLVRHLLVFDVMVVWSAAFAAAAVVVARRPAAVATHVAVSVNGGSPDRSSAEAMAPEPVPAPPLKTEPAHDQERVPQDFDEDLMQGFLAGAAAANAQDPHCWSWLYDAQDTPAQRSTSPEPVPTRPTADATATTEATPAEVGAPPGPDSSATALDDLLATSDLAYLEVLRSRSHLEPLEPPSPRRPS